MSGVLVLNASLEPLHRVSVTHAVRMLVREVAVVHESVNGRQIGPYPLPRVVRLVRYVVARWRFGRTPPWSRVGVLRRDGGLCAYCGRPGRTIDHVLPVSRGGGSEWSNTVTCCGACNQRKADRTPAEARMRLLRKPTAPSWGDLLHL
jgi:5-methylcytosine-specific restriction endonuclease McrA